MSDKELDKLFQEAASGLEPAYDPQDWEMLRARLDGDDKAAFVRRVTLRILVGAMLLSSMWSAWQSGDTKTSLQQAAIVETTPLLPSTDTALARTAPTHQAGDGTQAQAIPATTTEGPPNTVTDADKSTVRTGATGTLQEKETKQAASENTGAEQATAVDKTHAGVNPKSTIPAATGVDAENSKNTTGTTGRQTTNHRGGVQQRQTTATTRDENNENNSNNHTDRTGQVNAKQGKSATSVSNQRDSMIAVQRVAGRPVEVTKRSSFVLQASPASKGIPGVRGEASSDVKDGETVVAQKQPYASERDNRTSLASTEVTAVTTPGNDDPRVVPVTETENNKEQSAVTAVAKDDKKVVVGQQVPVDEKNKGFYPETQEAVRAGQHEAGTVQVSDGNKQAGESEDVYMHEQDNVIGVNGPPMRKRNKTDKIEGEEALAAAVAHDSTQVKEGEKKDSAQVASVNEEEKKEAGKLSRWYIKLPVSPDFSTIGYKRPGKPGINLGLLVEFMPVTRLGITAGAIWSRKIYTSTNPEKTYGSGAYQVKADWLDGECRVLDLPLNVTYYIRPEAKTNFLVTAGISSYIMLSEDYTYVVKGPTKDYVYNENFTRKNNDWASMLNLSIGIQHRLSRRFQVQAEPFLKAPLSGVGEGKVDLVSSGVFFSLKYQF